MSAFELAMRHGMGFQYVLECSVWFIWGAAITGMLCMTLAHRGKFVVPKTKETAQ